MGNILRFLKMKRKGNDHIPICYPNDWMSNLPETLTKLPLNWIAIPGTHDSFTYRINSHSHVSPDAEDIVFKLISIFGSWAVSVISRWAKAQDLDPYGQLNAGIRYFDIRSAINDKDNNEIYSCHSLFSGNIREDLCSINDFLKTHPKEVILLDLNHFYNFTQHDHLRLLHYLETIFSDKLVPYSRTIPTLDELWETSHRVFVFYHCENVHKPYLWPGYTIPSPWPNTDKLSMLLKFLSENYNEGHFEDYFYISQGVLTPTPKDYFVHMMESLKSVMASKASPGFAKWLRDKEIGKGKINCSIVDFADNYNYVESVLQLNFNFHEKIMKID